MYWYPILQVFVGLVFLLGCTRTPNPITTSSSSGPLNVEMWASASCIQSGQTIHLRATVTNRGDHTQIINLTDKPVLDIVFGNPDTGRRWSDDKPLTPDLMHIEIAPSTSKSIEMDWVGEQGSYGAVTIWAILNENNKGDRIRPGVTIAIGSCPGP